MYIAVSAYVYARRAKYLHHEEAEFATQEYAHFRLDTPSLYHVTPANLGSSLTFASPDT
jgi:hypothetical protein